MKPEECPLCWRFDCKCWEQRAAEKSERRCDPVAVGDDGWSEWLHPMAPSFFSQCCDCGLVHEMEFEIVPRDTHNTNLNPGEGESVIIFRARRALASGMEARRAAAENTDAVHDSPTAASGDAQ